MIFDKEMGVIAAFQISHHDYFLDFLKFRLPKTATIAKRLETCFHILDETDQNITGIQWS